MKTPVIEVETKWLDKWGDITKLNAEGNTWRISVYFDYDEDNHHIQFPQKADRKTVANLLFNLAELILKKRK